jgi:pilus assembly protein Flp/PilA
VAFRLLIQYVSAAGWKRHFSQGEIKMKNRILLLSVQLQNFLTRDEGQDLIEYALVVSLIAFAAVFGMKTLAADINTAFVGIGTTLTTDI